MQTKNIDTGLLKESDTHALVRVYGFIAELKNLYRQGWLRAENDIDREKAESVAEHIFSGALLAYLFCREYRPDVDAELVLKIFLFHDLGEAIVGDFTPHDDISPVEKSAREKAALHDIFKDLEKKEEYIKYWEMYEQQSCDEARIAKMIDKLDAALMARVYLSSDHRSVADFDSSVAPTLCDAESQDLFSALQSV